MTNDESKQTLERLRRTIGIEALLRCLPQQRVKRALQLRSMADLAGELDVPYETLRSRIASGQVPDPTIVLGRRSFFTAEQVEAIKRNWNR